MNRFVQGAAALLGMLCAPLASAQLFTYEIDSMTAVDLGTLGGEESEALDVNNNGDVVGWARQSNGVPHGFLLRDGNTVLQDVTSELGSLAAFASGINNTGQIVGHYDPPEGNAHSKAFVWMEGLPLKTLPPAFDYSKARAINELGRIVGEKSGPVPGNPYSTCTGLLPVQWEAAYAWYEMLYCVSGQKLQRATDLNNTGRIVGWENTTATGGAVAWTWNMNNGLKGAVPPPAGSVCEMRAQGVNNAGVVVGRASFCMLNSLQERAFVWNGYDATSTALGLLSGGSASQAYEVNDQNFIVGVANKFVYGGPLGDAVRDRAFIYHAHFGMTALPLPAGYLGTFTHCGAYSVSGRNNAGLIRAAGYCIKGSKKHAVRWDISVGTRRGNIPPVLL